MNRLRAWVLMAVAYACVSSSAHADAVTYNFTAVVTSSTYGHYIAGQTVTGSFSYTPVDTSFVTGVPLSLDPNDAEPLLSVGASADDDQTGTIQLFTESTSPQLFLEYSAYYNFRYNVAAGSFGFSIDLWSSNEMLLSPLVVPAVLPDLSNFDLRATVSYDYISPQTDLQEDYQATITSLALATPEPASLPLLTAGVLALGALRRRQP